MELAAISATKFSNAVNLPPSAGGMPMRLTISPGSNFGSTWRIVGSIWPAALHSWNKFPTSTRLPEKAYVVHDRLLPQGPACQRRQRTRRSLAMGGCSPCVMSKISAISLMLDWRKQQGFFRTPRTGGGLTTITFVADHGDPPPSVSAPRLLSRTRVRSPPDPLNLRHCPLSPGGVPSPPRGFFYVRRASW